MVGLMLAALIFIMFVSGREAPTNSPLEHMKISKRVEVNLILPFYTSGYA